MKERLLWLPVILVLIMAGCGSKSGTEKTANGEPVAATVNGKPIPVPEVQKVAANFLRQNVPPDSTVQGDTPVERMYYTAVNRLVEQQLLLAAAEKDSITVSDEEVQGSIAQLKTMAGGPDAWQKLLAENNATEADVQRDMRTNLVLKAYFDKVVNRNPEISDAEAKAYYDENQDRFGPQEEIKAKHILIRTPPNAPDSTKVEARKKIEDILAQVRAGGDFAALAEQYSEDPGARGRGGDLGWFRHGDMVAPFDSAAFALKKGQVSGVVTTNYGYHVIKLEDRRTSETRKFEDVAPAIKNMLAQQKSQEQFKAVVDSLRSAAKIDIVTPPPAGALEGIETGPADADSLGQG